MFFKYLILLNILFSLIYSYKILVVNPKFGYSHVNFFSQVADILTEAGHNITVLAIDLDPTIKHPGAYKAKVITYQATKEVKDNFANTLDKKFLWTLSNSGAQQFKLALKFMDGILKQSLRVFNDKELSEKIKREKFDLGITETMNVYIFGLFKVWGIKAHVAGFSMSLGPKTPKMVEVSGIGIKDPKPLDEYWHKILSLRNKTVLVSFGSFAKAIYMPDEMKNGLLETIKKLNDITFIWKYEEPGDGTGKDIENLIISKWLPQSDLLNDERLSLFVTHGGMGSTTELSFRGVPAIAIPILGDQMRNSKLIERQKCGIVMNKFELADSSKLIKNIKTILDDDSYKTNAKMVSKRLNKRPIGSKRLLIEHIEFAAEFGRLDMLDLASRNMNMIEYYNLDIIFPVIFGLFILLTLILYLIFKVVKKLFKPKAKID
uniref:glucuronosyltransferase n=1 Tax=Strongyloides papillosus TaxID=174720 RepID=A0A0N5BGR8_STREA